jgi:hypothetical protein
MWAEILAILTEIFLYFPQSLINKRYNQRLKLYSLTNELVDDSSANAL